MKGIIVTIRLLCKIYSNGYYYQCGEDECLLFTKSAGIGFVPNVVKEIVMGLTRRRFFDKGCFDQFGILTSLSIQQIYLEACDRRKSIDIIDEYWLSDPPESSNVNIISLNDDIYSQRKVKEKEIIVAVAKEKDPVLKNPDIAAEKDEGERLNYESLVKLFNEKTNGIFGTIRIPLNENRRKQLKARIREFGAASFDEMVQAVTRSDFLKGDNLRGFKATFDWMIKPSNYQKILEGNYENTKKQINATNRNDYTTIAERVRSESDALKQQLAAKYSESETIW